MKWHIEHFQQLRLDLVSLLAVLGEGSVTRTAQASSISWWSCLPRLLPAPQALLFHERPERLPVFPGIVAGAYSGNVRKQINFFAYLLHGDSPLPYRVEFIKVERVGPKGVRSFHFHQHGPLKFVMVLSFFMSIALLGWVISEDDGFGLLALVTLSSISALISFGTHWSLGRSFQEPEPEKDKARENALPTSDIVLYYPNGAIRVVSTTEKIARLYFEHESCDYYLGDFRYRAVAFFATLLLMAGVICLANAQPRTQVAFALAYVIINGLYWAVSSLKPQHHWRHQYLVEKKAFKIRPGRIPTLQKLKGEKEKKTLPWLLFLTKCWQQVSTPHPARLKESEDDYLEEYRNMTTALWAAIFLTGTSQWLNESTSIAPMNDAWKDWVRKADDQVRGKERPEVHAIRANDSIRVDMKKQSGELVFPDVWQWDFKGELTKSLQDYKSTTKRQRQPVLPDGDEQESA
ncbi:uncharacterized protein HMPREF1541_07275 [Cyphellophora europaea CBS 101466]|uniref:Uncharacterized protein n=1 Tax=Cyphellophora europaea (strain CBS 101466) TaxID=1220924 RepID=W2RMD7_CYPE1|nr:uncharacterized protein HMPREF1541_07275 [Cyphellophora europaea CBS 101466]ETN37652.1 hypothetical protein HMPREF1541_07275 [Cyphellophora europaea CBS 101466]